MARKRRAATAVNSTATGFLQEGLRKCGGIDCFAKDMVMAWRLSKYAIIRCDASKAAILAFLFALSELACLGKRARGLAGSLIEKSPK
jgi:hypothetical protein